MLQNLLEALDLPLEEVGLEALKSQIQLQDVDRLVLLVYRAHSFQQVGEAFEYCIQLLLFIAPHCVFRSI